MTLKVSKKRLKMTQEKEEAYSRKKGIKQHRTNPFWEATSVTVGTKRISISGGRHVSNEGESVEHSGIHIVRQVDESQFLKVYTKNIKAIFDLKPSTQKILQYLMQSLQKTPNAEGVYLSWFRAEEYFSEEDVSMSRTSFHRAMKELLQKGFIAESLDPNMFWFNPNLFFNGNRMTFVNEYRKVKSGKLKEDSNIEILEKKGQKRLID
jgi:hypothetical protein